MSTMSKPLLIFERLPHAGELELPSYETDGAAGMDIRAALEEPLTLQPGQRALVPTGFRMAVPEGYEAQIRPRSGLAWRNGITLLNTPGTIDSDYRGELKIILIHLGEEPLVIRHGDRIAQMVIAPVTRVKPVVAERLDETGRGEGGFGSTGIR